MHFWEYRPTCCSIRCSRVHWHSAPTGSRQIEAATIFDSGLRTEDHGMTYRRIVPNNNHYNCSQTFQLFLSPLRVSLEHSPWSVKQQSRLSPFLPLLISSVYVAISYCLFRGLSFSPVECLFFCIFILLLILIPCLDVSSSVAINTTSSVSVFLNVIFWRRILSFCISLNISVSASAFLNLPLCFQFLFSMHLIAHFSFKCSLVCFRIRLSFSLTLTMHSYNF